MVLLSFGMALLLGACGKTPEVANQGNSAKGNGNAVNAGNEQANNAASNTASDPAQNTASGDADTMTFHAGNGDVQVPKNPKRIVDLTDFYTGYFLALGAKPVGIGDGAMNNPYFGGMLDGVADIGSDASPEKILGLKPDLIVTYAGTENIEQLERIAPVVAIEYGKKNDKDQMLDFGKLTGKETEAKQWVEQWEKKIAELKPRIQDAVGGKTVSILNPYAKGLYVFGHNYGRGGEIIYGEFGLKAPAEAQKAAIDSGTGWASISLEKLPEFAGDIIFTCPWSGDTSDPKIVYDSPIWQGLPAVKAGHVFQLNPKADTYNDPVSLDAQLDFIANSLLSAKS
ncbi:iron-hydroxamate ABC transporter substrate-binding protein [Paenibacillus sp. MWE-103]|uniref:Iron-hydroxamate ABC transporter substrate-binding protein n=2 Tax=Paenibacillus artemisiicola TaxID=1172618 RepID=A0ABS3W3V9_9BACL|nr:iron-hydroxamate ABC transporter substrate-binding protein [Paenibacillus artemisiicola]